jgi:hypothetical protein
MGRGFYPRVGEKPSGNARVSRPASSSELFASKIQ